MRMMDYKIKVMLLWPVLATQLVGTYIHIDE